jgi:hypothetical protein
MNRKEEERFRMIDPLTFGIPELGASRRIDPVTLQPALLRDLRGELFPGSRGRFSPGVSYEGNMGDTGAAPESGPRNEAGK